MYNTVLQHNVVTHAHNLRMISMLNIKATASTPGSSISIINFANPLRTST